MKRIFALLLSALCLFALAGCGSPSSSAPAAAKDYAQIIQDARTQEENDYLMIARPGETEGTYTAVGGTSAEYEADALQSEIADIMLPMLGLQEGDFEDFAASVSLMMVRSYGVAIVKPAAGKTDAVKTALEGYVEGQRLSMEHYLPDQYEIAQAATVTVVPSGEVVLVCSENGAEVLASIQSALAA